MNNASNITLAESNKDNENLLSSKFVLREKKDNSVKVAAFLYTLIQEDIYCVKEIHVVLKIFKNPND